MEALLTGVRAGDAAARDRLITLLYPELKRLARIRMSHERADHTFGQTGSALVSQLWLRLCSKDGDAGELARIKEPQELLRIAVRDMRQILIDHARGKRAAKRPQPGDRVEIEDAREAGTRDRSLSADSLEVHEAIGRLREILPDPAYALELKYFWGFTNDEGADAMKVSVARFRALAKHGEAWVKDWLSRAE